MCLFEGTCTYMIYPGTKVKRKEITTLVILNFFTIVHVHVVPDYLVVVPVCTTRTTYMYDSYSSTCVPVYPRPGYPFFQRPYRLRNEENLL